MNQTRRNILLYLVVLLLLAACSGEDEAELIPDEDGAASEEAVVPSDMVASEATALPVEVIETAAPSLTDVAPGDLYTGTGDMPWWNDTVFYEIFVRSFQDSDGDGKGDISGLIERLDYLNDGDSATMDDLGVTGLWLMPIMESPSYHGYDVVDYLMVDSEYGTTEDFKRLIDEAHDRGIRVIVDLVLNHTSNQHPWFQEARDPDSDLRDWYIWSEDNPGFRGPWGQQVWHASGSDYYYGVFWEGMPDLNYENPEVTNSMLNAARFWLEDMGADGFRLDAIKHMVEDGSTQENTSETHDWLSGFYTFYKDVNPDAFSVGEAWTSTDEVLDYTGDEVDIAFQFDLARAILNSSQEGRGSVYSSEMAAITGSYPAGQYAIFITNHDQDRVLSQLDGDESAAKVAASLLLTSPGVPFIYYGEEIGMTGMKPDENIRRPMQWSGDNLRVDFTDGSPWRRPAKDYEERNVAVQSDDPDSLLSHYRSLIHLRNESQALRVGEWTPVDTGNDGLVAFLRHTEDEAILVLVNATRQTVNDYDLTLVTGPLDSPIRAMLLLGDGPAVDPEVNDAGGFAGYKPIDRLEPQSTYIIDLK
ncbi:MAG: alpha-amylase family glycosyl hydrolase [Candidatus Promineifilaceae bacterium]